MSDCSFRSACCSLLYACCSLLFAHYSWLFFIARHFLLYAPFFWFVVYYTLFVARSLLSHIFQFWIWLIVCFFFLNFSKSKVPTQFFSIRKGIEKYSKKILKNSCSDSLLLQWKIFFPVHMIASSGICFHCLLFERWFRIKF